VAYFNRFGSPVTSVAGCTREIKSRTAMANEARNKKRKFYRQIGLAF